MAHGELVALWQPMSFKPFHVSGMDFNSPMMVLIHLPRLMRASISFERSWFTDYLNGSSFDTVF